MYILIDNKISNYVVVGISESNKRQLLNFAIPLMRKEKGRDVVWNYVQSGQRSSA